MRRKIREREKKSDDSRSRYFKYKYEDELCFVLPFYKGIQQESYEDVCEYNDEGDNSSELKISELLHNDSQFETDEQDVKPDITELFDSEVNNSKDACASILKSGFTGKCCAVSTSQEKSVDPIRVFLEAVDSTLRGLNPYYLNVAKSKIFQVVQDCELQQIVNKGEPP